MAATMARSPGGLISGVFADAAAREGSYRFVENDAVSCEALIESAAKATAGRCLGEATVFVPVDATSLNLADPDGRRKMGTIGTHGVGAQGLHVMSAIAVTTEGVPVGMCGQRYWARRKRVGLQRDDYDPRGVEHKETRHWLDVLRMGMEALATSSTRPFFQLDRGGDCGAVLSLAADEGLWLTTRATHNRRVRCGGTVRYLWPTVAAVEPQLNFLLAVPEGPNRMARVASVHVQYRPVEVDLKDRRSGRHRAVKLWAVRVYEIDSPPRGQERIEWMLLTTYPVQTPAGAMFVVRGYTSRWRIEEFHKTLKSGACKVEDTLLHRREHVERFAVLCSSVAVHIQRLLHLSRVSPDEPAIIALTRHEIDATILLRKPEVFVAGDTPPLSLVVRWIADLGGFMGNAQSTIRKKLDAGQSVRQPGAIVLRRGLERILPVATLLSDGTFKL